MIFNGTIMGAMIIHWPPLIRNVDGGATWTQTRQRREIHSIQTWGMYIGVDSKTKLIHTVILPL